jgi:hypothetical protein
MKSERQRHADQCVGLSPTVDEQDPVQTIVAAHTHCASRQASNNNNIPYGQLLLKSKSMMN